MNELDLSPEIALKTGKVDGIALPMFADERPLLGVIGELDWWFNQAFTKAIRAGIFSGAEGEKIYMPVKYQDKTLHFFILGQGMKNDSGRIVSHPKEFLKTVNDWAKDFKIEKMAISRSELTMEGSFDLWILQ